MATSYPGGTDNLTNPAGTTFLTGVDHAAQHANINDAMEAVQKTLGTTAGTSVIKNFSAGDFAARVNNESFGSPTITGGTANNLVFGTPDITGGTLDSSVINTATIGTPDMTGGSLDAATLGSPTVQGGTLQKPVAQALVHNYATASDAATVSFDFGTANLYTVTIDGNRTFEVSNTSVGQPMLIRVTQGTAGSHTVTWFGTINWQDGDTTPTLTTTASQTDVFGFLCTASNQYDGYVVAYDI